jgi:hypothetical protein
MKKLLALALCCLPSLAQAQDWVPRQQALIQALDKVTARVTVLEGRVGESLRFGTLTIRIGGPPVFRGWMFADAPGVNMLEHPVYDVRILSCL